MLATVGFIPGVFRAFQHFLWAPSDFFRDFKGLFSIFAICSGLFVYFSWFSRIGFRNLTRFIPDRLIFFWLTFWGFRVLFGIFSRALNIFQGFQKFFGTVFEIVRDYYFAQRLAFFFKMVLEFSGLILD